VSALVRRALAFAAEKHRKQLRKDADRTPYMNHVVAVAATLRHVGGVTDPEILAAALLHDTVEDTETTPDELERAFGPRVRALVAELTDDKSLAKDVRKELQVEHADGLSPEAKQLKLCDKICNVLDVTHSPAVGWSLERRREYLDWTARVIAHCRGVNPALEARYDQVLAAGREALDRAGEAGVG